MEPKKAKLSTGSSSKRISDDDLLDTKTVQTKKGCEKHFDTKPVEAKKSNFSKAFSTEKHFDTKHVHTKKEKYSKASKRKYEIISEDEQEIHEVVTIHSSSESEYDVYSPAPRKKHQLSVKADTPVVPRVESDDTDGDVKSTSGSFHDYLSMSSISSDDSYCRQIGNDMSVKHQDAKMSLTTELLLGEVEVEGVSSILNDSVVQNITLANSLNEHSESAVSSHEISALDCLILAADWILEPLQESTTVHELVYPNKRNYTCNSRISGVNTENISHNIEESSDCLQESDVATVHYHV